ncbi:MAG: FAD binding domain-containing protein, partial [Acidobacteriota bacterium]
MYPPTFDYIRAESVDHAIALLGEHEDAKLMAGGHSLLPMMKLRLALPPTVIDIGRVDGLAGVSVDGGRVRVGALTTHHDVATSDLVRSHAPLLAEAAAKIGDPAVRNRG